jgi:glycosyltransferase involved in cell wall biosynthesis
MRSFSLGAMPEVDRPSPTPAPARRLRIGIDAHAVGERKTGNERFIANLIPALRARCDHDLFLYVTTEEGKRALTARRFERTVVRRIRPATPIVRVPIALPIRALRDRLDVLFVQYTAGPIVPCPVVTVVHDVAFWKHPEFFALAERTWMRRVIPFTIRHAAGIVTVSRFSRDEIASSFGVDPSTIAVAHEAADPIFLRPSSTPAGIDPPYFLALGNLQPRKNLAVLIRGYRALAEARPEIRERLVIVGQPSLDTAALTAEAADLVAAGRVVFTGYLSDERIVALLAGATAFAFPSLYEGFGLPVIEAMAAGTPTLVADIPVMREVAGDAAIHLPATDPDAWARALEDLALHPERRAALADTGRRHADAFSWDATAEVVLEAIEGAALQRG